MRPVTFLATRALDNYAQVAITCDLGLLDLKEIGCTYAFTADRPMPVAAERYAAATWYAADHGLELISQEPVWYNGNWAMYAVAPKYHVNSEET